MATMFVARLRKFRQRAMQVSVGQDHFQPDAGHAPVLMIGTAGQVKRSSPGTADGMWAAVRTITCRKFSRHRR